MTEQQATELLSIAKDVRFLLHACAMSLGLVWGALIWRGIVLGKNSRELW